MGDLVKINGKKFYLVLAAILFLFIFKLFMVTDPFLIITTTIFESLIFILLLAFTGSSFDNVRWKKITRASAFYVLFFFHLTLTFLYSYYLDEVAGRRLSLAGMEWGMIVFFFKDIFPLKLIFYYLVLVVLVLVVVYLIKIKEITLKRKYFWGVVICALILILLIPFVSYNRFSNPYVNTISDFKHNLLGTKIAINTENMTEDDMFFLQKNGLDYNGEVPYDRILVFLMEGVVYDDFLDDIEKLPEENNFFLKLKNNSHYYSNYYTTNQDSRTAIMAMLSSTFVPFEAYSHNNWQELYADKIMEEDNLIKYLNRNDYSTEFMISSVETPVVSRTYPWTKKHHLEEFEEDGEFLCLHVMEYQHGCEDEIMLEDLKEVIMVNPNLFLFQEMVYGHGFQYFLLKRKSLTEYYNDYLLKIYDFLVEEGLWENTLIVLVSDHGSKNYRKMVSKKGYHIPLVMINSQFDYLVDDALYSHLDFKDILFDKQENNDFVFFVGATKSSLIGYINRVGHYAVVQGDVVVGKDKLYDQLATEEKISLFKEYERRFTLGLI